MDEGRGACTPPLIHTTPLLYCFPFLPGWLLLPVDRTQQVNVFYLAGRRNSLDLQRCLLCMFFDGLFFFVVIITRITTQMYLLPPDPGRSLMWTTPDPGSTSTSQYFICGLASYRAIQAHNHNPDGRDDGSCQQSSKSAK